MRNIKVFCDGCGIEITGKNLTQGRICEYTIFRISPGTELYEEELDLCDSCDEAFYKFIDNFKGKQKQKLNKPF